VLFWHFFVLFWHFFVLFWSVRFVRHFRLFGLLWNMSVRLGHMWFMWFRFRFRDMGFMWFRFDMGFDGLFGFMWFGFGVDH
jgi:hypothetical protein